MDSWRTWALVLPALERRHDVLALTLPGHAGGPPLSSPDATALLAGVERVMDDAGFATAHLVGNSLGGYLALRLAARGRAESVVALAPAGGWAREDRSVSELFAFQARLRGMAGAAAANADALLSTIEGRRRATESVTERFEHIPKAVLVDQLLAVAGSDPALLERAAAAEWELDAERIRCPVRIVWGTADRLLPWPSAAVRYREEWLPHADWVVLDDVGHAPQLDVPLETAELILGFTA
jgi:pimeloyl-ACP methyl ester carboxylesterase